MNAEDVKSYLSNIEEAVFDEEKIVSYNWLSKTFGIHCNFSKQLLYKFFENSPKKDELIATYLLIGLPKEAEAQQVLIVKDKDLHEAESNLKSITSKHIYSIQKGKDLSDINVLYIPLVDESSNSFSKGVSAIEFNSKERDNALIAKLRHDALPAATTLPVVAKKASSCCIQPVTKNKSPVKNGGSGEESNKVKNIEKDGDSKSGDKKPVIPSMFGNATGPKKKLPEKTTTKPTKKAQGIGAFFTKSANKPTTEPKKESPNSETKKEVEPDSKIKERLSPLKENKATLNICTEKETTTTKKEESPKGIVTKSKKADNKPKAPTKKVSNKGGKKKTSKKSDNDQKKRKRLVVLSDSDSNSGSEDEEELPREPTPEPQPTVIPDEEDMDDVILGTPEPSKKRKKRKLISKTFTCPDGFMVTEKHYEDVSASGEEEEEDPVPEKKFKSNVSEDKGNTKDSEKKESPKIKTPSPQKTKQSSLMNFFKKK